MKSLKQIVIITNLLALLCLLSGCGISIDKSPFTYTFRQTRSNISKIEICAYAPYRWS